MMFLAHEVVDLTYMTREQAINGGFYAMIICLVSQIGALRHNGCFGVIYQHCCIHLMYNKQAMA